MDYQFPTDFDLIIVGTGMVESILSAAASRVGKKILHIDSNAYYGGQWASFNLTASMNLENINNTENIAQEELQKLLKEGEEFYKFGNDLFNIENIKHSWHISNEDKEVNDSPLSDHVKEEDNIHSNRPLGEIEIWNQKRLIDDSRKFNIDLAPKLQFARGDFVELLISSNIARYSEYRSVSRILTWINGQLEVVPCSRSDVFSNNKISVIEKRMLMKLLTSLDDTEKDCEQYKDKTFREFLKAKKLTPNLIHFVLYAISMSTDTTTCDVGVKNTKRFLSSLGRFGKTPFLFSMYGSGEITQAFCRLSAVFGGIFALNQPLKGLITSEHKFKAVIVGEQRIEAEHLVMGIEKSPKKYVQSVKRKNISRGVLITDKSITPSEKEHLTFVLYPSEHSNNLSVILELGTLTGTCPKDLYIVHLISKEITSPIEDFKHIINNLFNTNVQFDSSSEKPRVLWSQFFSLPDSSDSDLKKDSPNNIYICPGPDTDLDYDQSVKMAKDIFNSIYPGLEFLPRAPDPEEIIIEGDETEDPPEL